MLWLHVDVCEDLEFDAVLTVEDVENSLSVRLLGLGQLDFVFVLCVFGLSKADLVILQDGEELLPHVVLEVGVMSRPHALGQVVVLSRIRGAMLTKWRDLRSIVSC
jgi:hypothetical protein